jgi:formylglycine-generating enzyme required for sulfatase activity
LQIIKNYPGDISDALLLRLVTVLERAEQAGTGNDTAPVAPAWPKGKSPFPGLNAFDPDDAPVFFGREVETEHLLERISNPRCRFLVVMGASGSGKSSLVSAGLLPRLKEGALPGSEAWPVLSFSPDALGNGDPFTALTGVLKEPPFRLDSYETRQRLLGNQTGLRELLEQHLAGQPEPMQVLLFIDQFEELFTRVTDADYRQKFLALLNEAINSPRLLTIVTIRDDFFHYFAKYPLLSRLVNRNDNSTYTLSAPGMVELYEMIAGPARVAGLQCENGLVRHFLGDTGNNPGALALMAYALDQLFNAAGRTGELTSFAYQSFGGVQGAIGMRAQETFDKLSIDAQEKLPTVFSHLLEVDESGTATRKRVPIARVEQDAACHELVQALVEARLLVTSRGVGDQALLEVAHEALFRSWPALKAWIETVQDDLILLRQVRAAVALWQKHARQPAYLWPDERLRPVYAMRDRLKPDLDANEQEFIRREVERLLEEIDNPATNHRRRSWIGERMDTLGDPRPGVGLVRGILPLGAVEKKAYAPDDLRPGELRLWGDKSEYADLPDLVWLSVPGGSIQIEQQTFTVQPFHIAKYPITYRQFRAFVDAPDGFPDSRWWQGLSTDSDHKSKPVEQNFKFDNHPRENVSWYDAVAFCRWLNDRLGWPAPDKLESPGLRLPAEWEWQWAATGGQPSFAYPWGVSWDGTRANTSESGLARTTAVGMYPSGAASCGALDLSGNVWEWCLNEYRKPQNVELRGNSTRVLRGGAWDNYQDRARAAYRNLNTPPGSRFSRYGFRVVVRPPSL